MSRDTTPTRGDSRPRVVGVVGLLLLVLGGAVLRSPGARDVGFGWFAYGPEAPSPAFLDGLVAWNLLRGVGAALVVVGLALVVLALATVLARRGAPTTRTSAVLAVVALVLVVVGAVAFGVLGARGREGATVGIGKSQGQPRQVALASTVWTPSQAGAGLVVVAGLLVGSAALGLRAGRRVSGRAEGRRTAS